MTMELGRSYIGGSWVPVSGSARQVLVDASTEDPFGAATLAGAADVDRAVAAAREAFPAWSTTDPATRIAFVERMRAVHLERTEDMARAISREMGAPIDLARQAQAEGTIPAEHDPLALTMMFFGMFNGLNLVYGQEWLSLPPETLKAGMLRLLGVQT